MAFDLNPRDPLEPTQELPDAPLAEVITQLAEGVAEGQARLDLSAAQVASVLASSRVSIIPSVRQIIREDGTTRFETAAPVEVSLLELGITPTFYAFSEATAEVAMDLKVTESITETGTSEQRTFLSMGTRSLRTERRLNKDVTVHSKLSVKLVPVPTPVRLEPTTITIEEEGESPPSPEVGGGVSSVALEPSTAVGGTTSEGTITLSAPAPAGGVNVTLSSANPAIVKVPSSVSVPEGSTTAQFQVTTEPVSSSTPVTITASGQGVQQTTSLTVQPPSPTGFAFSPQQIAGGATSTGTITLSGPAPSGTSVALSGSNTNTAEFPATVPVDANATQVTFSATGATFTGGDRSVNVTALYLGGTRSDTLTVKGAAAPSSVTVNPTTVVGKTATVQGTVTLNAPAPAGGVNVTLSSANPAIVRVPSSVSVPEGSTTAQFQVTTEPVSSSTPVTITASGQGVQQTTSLTVQPPAPTGFAFSPQQIAGGAASTGTITLSGPAPSGTSVTLTRSNTTTANIPSSVAVPLNATQVTFSATGLNFVGANQSVTVTATYLGVTRTASLTVEGKPAPTLAGFTFSPQQIAGGATSTGTITLSGPAPSGTSVTLTRSNTITANIPSSVAVPLNATQVTFSATGVTFIGTSRSVTVTASYFGSTRAASLTVVGEEKVEKELAIAKEIETEFRARQSTGVESREAPEERSGEGTEEGDQSTAEEPEGPASGRAFVEPAERDLPGQEALDQAPAQEEEKRKEEKTRARRGRKKKRPEG